MAKVRVKDMASISTNAQDDKLMTDGTTNGTKSISVNDFLKQVPVRAAGGIDYSSDQNDPGLEVKLNGSSLTKGASGLSVTDPVPTLVGVSDGQVLTKTTTSGTATMEWSDVLPPQGTNQHRGDVLTVDNSDGIVWATPAPPPSVTVDNETLWNDQGTLKVKYGEGLVVHTYEGTSTLTVENPVPGIADVTNGFVLTKTQNDYNVNQMEWLAPEKELPTLTGHSNGDVLTIGNGAVTWAAPATELPATTGHTDGDVLTIDNGSVTWAAPQGGGSSLPAYTTAEVGKVLGVTGIYEWEGYNRVLVDAETSWVPGIPDMPSMGSASEQGWEPVMKKRNYYNQATGQWVIENYFTGPGVPYNYVTNKNGNVTNTYSDDAGSLHWTINGNKAIVEVDNELMFYPVDLDDSGVTQVEIRIIVNYVYKPPFANIKFQNTTGNTITVTCTYGTYDNGSFVRWEDGPGYMFGAPMKQVTLCGTTISNSVANNKYVDVHVLGTSYTIYTD